MVLSLSGDYSASLNASNLNYTFIEGEYLVTSNEVSTK
jgi:hypothetical protein